MSLFTGKQIGQNDIAQKPLHTFINLYIVTDNGTGVCFENSIRA